MKRSPDPVAHPAEQVVADYLGAMEARDLEAAKRCLSSGFSMTFPGPAVFRAPEELVAWARDRYRSVGKIVDAMESFGEGAITVVYCRGTLHGEWPDGSRFSDIRFIDRFTVEDGLLTSQMVWNDLAERQKAL
jgi:hypothetical protein